MTGWGSTAVQGDPRGVEGGAVLPGRCRGGTEAERARALRAAVSGLRHALARHPVELPDRAVAEEELAALAAMAAESEPEPARLRGALLLVLGALGSVSALAEPLAELNAAISRFGPPPGRR
ncbi:DUF5955 family protein [Streptomyces alkaliterrae]|uniref:DUF5955 family protein n=1 Tax=Streptomyces alkaliterrae TaxID=2213162 RepID=UPI003F68FBCB